MIWRTGKPSKVTMIGLALFSILVFFLAERTATPEKQAFFEKKLQAANLAQLAQQAVRNSAESMGLKIDPQNDPYATGIIGQERTAITTDRGVVVSKVLATNPNYAAAFVELLQDAHVHARDVVAVGMTGSLPGWNIAFLAACKVLDVRPLIITSVGASDWGANVPGMTWLDMETIFAAKGLWKFKSLAASVGGSSDNGRGLSPEGRDLLREAIRRNHVQLIAEDTLEASIQKRMDLYRAARAGKRIVCYVNIGGGAASVGGVQNVKLIPPGLTRHLAIRNFPIRAVINRMAEEGLPVINLLDVPKLAPRWNFPIVLEDKPPEIGQGTLFFQDRYSVTNTIVLTLILAAVLFVFIRIDLAHYLFRRKRKPAMASEGENDDLL